MKLNLYFSIYMIFMGGSSLYSMFLTDATLFEQNFSLQRSKIKGVLREAMKKDEKTSNVVQESLGGKSLQYLVNSSKDDQYSEPMSSLFDASEQLVLNESFYLLCKHPLYKYFSKFSERDSLSITLKSGPDIQDFTDILLKKHDLDFDKVSSKDKISLKVFTTIETFLRCLEIFKNAYFNLVGKAIKFKTTYNLSHSPLDDFCDNYIKANPELPEIKEEELDQIINLISIHEIDNKIVNLSITLTMQIDSNTSIKNEPCFAPIALELNSINTGASRSNDISIGQKDLNKQIQNLVGSDLAMIDIKKADGRKQFEAFNVVRAKDQMNVVEIGGGRGETNALWFELNKAGHQINLLNIEPHAPFEESYIKAHRAVGIDNVHVMKKKTQDLSVDDVISHFKGKADVVFASHSFYFILADLHRATQSYINNYSVELDSHPLTKYFDMLNDDGVLIVTLQSGAGTRLFRNALLHNHGLDKAHNTETEDQATLLLQSFGNLATFMRHLEYFAKIYQLKRGKKIVVNMHCSVAKVPLGDLKFTKDTITHGNVLEDSSLNSVENKMMDFYGNWKELQTLATLTFEKAQDMSLEDLSAIGIHELTKEIVEDKQKIAIKTQNIFLHILRVFAPGQVNMLHPNITLEITVNPA